MASTEGKSQAEDEPQKGSSDKPMTAGQRLAAQKAAKAARKAADRGKDAEHRESEVISRAAAAGEWLRNNRRTMWATLAAVVLLAAGITGYAIHRGQQAEQASKKLWEATTSANAAVTGPDAPTPEDGNEAYASYVARGEKASDAFGKVLDEHPGARASLWARLGEGNGLLQAEQPKTAQKRFAAVLDDAADHEVIQWRAREGLAFAYEAQERWDDAASEYEAMAELDGGRYQNLADYHLARVQLARGDEGAAKETLQQLLDRLQQQDEDAPELPYTRRRAEERMAALDPSYSPTPTGFGPRPGAATQPPPSAAAKGGKGLQGLGAKGAKGTKIDPSQLDSEQVQKLLEKLKKQKGAGGPPAGGAKAPMTSPGEPSKAEGAPAGGAPEPPAKTEGASPGGAPSPAGEGAAQPPPEGETAE